MFAFFFDTPLAELSSYMIWMVFGESSSRAKRLNEMKSNSSNRGSSIRRIRDMTRAAFERVSVSFRIVSIIELLIAQDYVRDEPT